jgi:hypothetical protein
MFEVYMLQPVTSACDLFASSCRHSYVAEPNLDEVMNDPITRALMAADRVDDGELQMLFDQLRDSLRQPIARLSV